MTRDYNAHITCPKCGARITNESSFGRWMRAQPALDSVDGFVRTDLDHLVLRYKTSIAQKDYQLMQIVEVKEWMKEPRSDQIDALSFLRQLVQVNGKNLEGEKTFCTHKLYSKFNERKVNVRFYGVHLLQFERTNPEDGKIFWDRKEIDKGTLIGLLAMERRPDKPDEFTEEFLRDRHSRRRNQLELIKV